MLLLSMSACLLQVHCFDVEKLNRMYEARYNMIFQLEIFFFWPSNWVVCEREGRKSSGISGYLPE